MKHTLISLVCAAPALSLIASHADAAAITVNRGALRPHFLKAASLGGRITASTSGDADSVPAASTSGAVLKTGAGTLTLGSSNTYLDGTIASDFLASNGSLTINTGVGAGTTLTGVIGAGTAGLTLINSGTLTLNANAFGNFGVGQTLAALNIGDGAVVVLNGGFVPAPAAASADPVPEPGTAMLFALGMIVAGPARRRRSA